MLLAYMQTVANASMDDSYSCMGIRACFINNRMLADEEVSKQGIKLITSIYIIIMLQDIHGKTLAETAD